MGVTEEVEGGIEGDEGGEEEVFCGGEVVGDDLGVGLG